MQVVNQNSKFKLGTKGQNLFSPIFPLIFCILINIFLCFSQAGTTADIEDEKKVILGL